MTIERLREKHEATPKAPWIADVRIGVVKVYAGEQQNCLAAPHDNSNDIYARDGERVDGAWKVDPRDEANATAIVTEHNTYAALLDVAEFLATMAPPPDALMDESRSGQELRDWWLDFADRRDAALYRLDEVAP